MSGLTYSLMSNPDIALTMEAYAFFEVRAKARLEEISHIHMAIPSIVEEQKSLKRKLQRVRELQEALVTETEKRNV